MPYPANVLSARASSGRLVSGAVFAVWEIDYQKTRGARTPLVPNTPGGMAFGRCLALRERACRTLQTYCLHALPRAAWHLGLSSRSGDYQKTRNDSTSLVSSRAKRGDLLLNIAFSITKATIHQSWPLLSVVCGGLTHRVGFCPFLPPAGVQSQ